MVKGWSAADLIKWKKSQLKSSEACSMWRSFLGNRVGTNLQSDKTTGLKTKFDSVKVPSLPRASILCSPLSWSLMIVQKQHWEPTAYLSVKEDDHRGHGCWVSRHPADEWRKLDSTGVLCSRFDRPGNQPPLFDKYYGETKTTGQNFDVKTRLPLSKNENQCYNDWHSGCRPQLYQCPFI